MKTRYFYHTDEEKIYTLSELEKLYNELVTSGDINTEEESFHYYIDVCTDKNGALTEIYGNLTVIYTDEEGNETSIIFDNYKDAFTVCSGKNIDRYTLTDYNGNKIDINTLNGYQKGIILNDCYAYFEGGQYQNGATEPCGVIDIEETETEGEPKQ